jgi:hypothetical protein
MSFWKRLFGGADLGDSLASRLASDHELTFIAAVREAGRYATDGSATGLAAMEEAMRRRSGNKHLTFMKSKLGTLTVRLGSEIAAAPDELIELAKHRSLLRDPVKSQDLMSACIHDIGTARELAIRCREAGGQNEMFAFQLLYSHMIGAVTLDRARGKKGIL